MIGTHHLKNHQKFDFVESFLKSCNITDNDFYFRQEAVSAGQALLDNGWIERADNKDNAVFEDEYIFFEATKVTYSTEIC